MRNLFLAAGGGGANRNLPENALVAMVGSASHLANRDWRAGAIDGSPPAPVLSTWEPVIPLPPS